MCDARRSRTDHCLRCNIHGARDLRLRIFHLLPAVAFTGGRGPIAPVYFLSSTVRRLPPGVVASACLRGPKLTIETGSICSGQVRARALYERKTEEENRPLYIACPYESYCTVPAVDRIKKEPWEERTRTTDSSGKFRSPFLRGESTLCYYPFLFFFLSFLLTISFVKLKQWYAIFIAK